MRQQKIQTQFQVDENEIVIRIIERTGFSEKEVRNALDLGLSPAQIYKIRLGNNEFGLKKEDLNTLNNQLKGTFREALVQQERTDSKLRELLPHFSQRYFSTDDLIGDILDRRIPIDQDKHNSITEAIESYNASTLEIRSVVEEIRDQREINANESKALRIAEKLELFYPKKAESLYIQAIEGTIDSKTRTQIEEVQKALKADKKYDGEIDGKWGIKSRQGLKDLVIENAEALITDSQKLQKDQHLKDVNKVIKQSRNY